MHITKYAQYCLIILWENMLGNLQYFQVNILSLNTQSHCHTSRLGLFPFSILSKNNFIKSFPLESWKQNTNYMSSPITQGAFLKSVLGIQLLFAHTLIKCKAFKSECFKLNGWVSAKQIYLVHRTWSIANYNSITMKGLNSINKIQIFKFTWAAV